MGRIVIACFRPKPGKNEELRAIVRGHMAILRAEGLVTEREAILMEAQDGSVLEVFEWISSDAIDRAHKNPRVLAMWETFAEVCDYIPVGELGEAGQLFSEFTPL